MDKMCSCLRGIADYRGQCRECRNEYAREYQKRRYSERKIEALALLGGVCIDCGSDDDLEFDHVDPESKFKEVTEMFSKYSWKRVCEELLKCVLRCQPCHSLKSVDNGDVYVVDHGGGLSGKKNCPCQPCKDRKAEYMRGYDPVLAGTKPYVRQKKLPRQKMYADIARQEKMADNNVKLALRTTCKCGNTKHQTSAMCLPCSNDARKISEELYPPLEELVLLVKASSFSAVGRSLNISATTVRRHLKKNGVDPSKVK